MCQACCFTTNYSRNNMERKNYYKVRYAGKLIKVIPAHSKWEAIDRIYNDNINEYPWIKRDKLTAVKSK
jgi:hypothetical protein